MRTDPANIALLIKEGEGLTLEFKEHFTSRIDEDMVAFANKGERAGTGILRMREALTAAGLESLEIINESFFSIIFKRPVVEDMQALDTSMLLIERLFLQAHSTHLFF